MLGLQKKKCKHPINENSNPMKYFNFLILLWFPMLTHGQFLERIEPPFWWSDMKHADLQVVLYGKNIAEYEIKVSDGVIRNIRKTENPNYIFMDWDTKDMAAGTYQIEFIKKGKIVFTQAYELKKRREHSEYRKGFDASDAIYLLMPDRFANGNPKNDSIPEMLEKSNRGFDGGRHGGDIQGIIDHLDYLDDLGVTALWSTPLLEDNEPRYSYHTYAQSNYYQIDPRFGSNEDYVSLSHALHQRGMKNIMDYVTNHWGSKHWMIQDLPTRDWIHVWENGEKGFQRSSYRMTTQFDLYASESDKAACMDGWFDTTMPDMNQSNPLLNQYMIQNAIWWIEYADLDGLRVDTYSYNDKKGISEWTKAILDEYPNFNIVGEVWMHDQAQISFWQKDSPIAAIQGYNSYLPSVMDFTLHDAIMQMFDENKIFWDNGLQRAYDNFANDFLYDNPMNIMIFAGNHDTARINTLLKSDLKKYQLVFTLLTTMRGFPQIYYGDEIGMIGDKAKGDGDIRYDFPGGWLGDTQNAFRSDQRTEQQEAYHSFTKKLLNWRKNAKVIHEGKFLHYVPYNNVYLYFRYTENENVLTIINNSTDTQTIDWNRIKEGTSFYTKGKDVISGRDIVVGTELKIEPKTSMIIELKK
jgi:glycosidase